MDDKNIINQFSTTGYRWIVQSSLNPEVISSADMSDGSKIHDILGGQNKLTIMAYYKTCFAN